MNKWPSHIFFKKNQFVRTLNFPLFLIQSETLIQMYKRKKAQ